MKKVSLYIPSFNPQPILLDVIRAVMCQTYPVDELIVVDDGSDREVEVLLKGYPVKVIRHPYNQGLAAARNTALRTARNEWVASLDADCVPAVDWLEKLVEAVNLEGVVAAGGCLHEAYSIRLADRWRAKHMCQHWGMQNKKDPPFLFGCNLLINRQATIRVGLYQEKFKTNYEDVDMSRRLRGLGFNLMYCPQARAEHRRHDSVASALISFVNWYKQEHIAHEKTGHWLADHKRCFAIARKLCVFCLKKDMRAGSYALIGMDLMLFFYVYFAACAYKRDRV